MSDLTAKQVRELFQYDAETGVFTRRTSRGGMKAGDRAGCDRKDGFGYWTMNINRRAYLVHRVVWLYVHGKWPTEHIDHINGNPGDNRIANLREASRSQNHTNSKVRKDNKSGFKGVSWAVRDKKWLAQIQKNNKTYNLGVYDTPEQAHEVYCQAAVRLHGEFARLK